MQANKTTTRDNKITNKNQKQRNNQHTTKTQTNNITQQDKVKNIKNSKQTKR